MKKLLIILLSGMTAVVPAYMFAAKDGCHAKPHIVITNNYTKANELRFTVEPADAASIPITVWLKKGKQKKVEIPESGIQQIKAEAQGVSFSFNRQFTRQACKEKPGKFYAWTVVLDQNGKFKHEKK